MLIRNVGHLMTNPAILDRDGNEVPEGIMDAMITGLIALYDVGPNGRRKNSRAGSVYVVKPKMHGPEEVAFAVEIFSRVEDALGWRATPSRWASWTRSAAPPSTSRNASAPPASASSSSTPASSIAPATRCTPRWKPAR
jgi:hypothetical protein